MVHFPSGAVLILAAGLLAGCENDAASYQIGGSKDHALTLIREQRYLWQRESDVALVVAHAPQCQRRHALNRTPVQEPRAELFQTAAGSFVLRNGPQWYAIDIAGCAAAKVTDPGTAARGRLIGAFDRQGGRLRFSATETKQ